MKAAIYNPYFDTLGGGERYTASFAKVLLNAGWDVDIEWEDQSLKDSIQKRFGINLTEAKIVNDIKRGDGYDLCFWVSDGSIPTLKARKNILHFQVPFHGVGGNNLLNKMKLFRIEKVICNSMFTKKIIDKEYGIESIVLYPPVDVEHIKSKRKENIILFVGRFSQLKQNKNQHVLVEAFKKMTKNDSKDWKLILAGGVEVGVADYLKDLEKMSEGSSIEIIKSPDYTLLKDLYGKAKFFWSASGFDVNENTNPENVEHFGMTVVEAMAAGAIPLLYDAGGHKEIVKDGENGFLWKSIEDLVDKTKKLIENHSVSTGIAEAAKIQSKEYSFERFEKEILSYIL